MVHNSVSIVYKQYILHHHEHIIRFTKIHSCINRQDPAIAQKGFTVEMFQLVSEMDSVNFDLNTNTDIGNKSGLFCSHFRFDEGEGRKRTE